MSKKHTPQASKRKRTLRKYKVANTYFQKLDFNTKEDDNKTAIQGGEKDCRQV